MCLVRPTRRINPARSRATQPTSRVRTLAFGVIVDPNISQPLPFAGLSYLDFNLFGTGTQFNGFFGGSYGQLAFSVPSIARSRWQMAGRAFGIASSYNDRAFAGGREQYDRNVRQRPAAASVWLVRPLTAAAGAARRLRPRVHRAGAQRGDRADVRRAGRPGRPRPAARSDGPARRLGRLALVGRSRRAGWRAMGTVRFGRLSSQRRRLPTLRRESLARALAVSPRVVARVEARRWPVTISTGSAGIAFGTFETGFMGIRRR